MDSIKPRAKAKLFPVCLKHNYRPIGDFKIMYRKIKDKFGVEHIFDPENEDHASFTPYWLERDPGGKPAVFEDGEEVFHPTHRS